MLLPLSQTITRSGRKASDEVIALTANLPADLAGMLRALTELCGGRGQVQPDGGVTVEQPDSSARQASAARQQLLAGEFTGNLLGAGIGGVALLQGGVDAGVRRREGGGQPLGLLLRGGGGIERTGVLALQATRLAPSRAARSAKHQPCGQRGGGGIQGERGGHGQVHEASFSAVPASPGRPKARTSPSGGSEGAA